MTRLWAGKLRNCSIPVLGKRFLSSPKCPVAARATYPPVQWISTAFSVGVKCLGYETIAIQADAVHPVVYIDLRK
jgi:hypothetical protein